jgi:hypothetical protein
MWSSSHHITPDIGTGIDRCEQGTQRVPRSYVTVTNQSPTHWEVALPPASVSRLLKSRFGKMDTQVRQKGVDTR